MKRNIGLFEAFLRTMAGFMLFGKGVGWKSNLAVGAGSMMLATGITRFCPCYQMFGKSTCDTPWEYAKSTVGKIKH